MKTVFPHPVCPHIVAEWAVCGKLWRTGHLQYWVAHPWRQKDRCSKRLAFAGIFYAAAATMKAVTIACPEVKPQWVLAGQEFSQIDVCQGQVFCGRSYGVTLTAGRKILLCLVPHLIGFLVGCFGVNGPLRQYFSLYLAVSQREGERKEKWQTREKMSKQLPPAPTASAVSPCPTLIQISRTPRYIW